jgi:hypothetical protein
MKRSAAPVLPASARWRGPFALSAALLAALSSLGCFRASGLERNPMVAEVLPETGGDQVLGLKRKAGSGDLYIGNDFIQMAIDSTVFGDSERMPMVGAASGGSIVDAGYLLLNDSYARVSIPGTAMHRLTPVVNQDQRLEVVFDQYTPVNGGSNPTIIMSGRVYDPQGVLAGAAHAGDQTIANVSVLQQIQVGQLDRFFTMTTTVTNNGSTAVPITSVGDCLLQQGGGYHFNIPADANYQGVALGTSWGVQIPGSSLANPLTTSVQASMVGLMDTEPGAATCDSHASVGILPLDADRLLVASAAQDMLTIPTTASPSFPAWLAVGSLPASGALQPGASITFNRRLYILGGQSIGLNLVGGLSISANYADQATGLFNLMDTARYNDTTIRPAQDTGLLTFTLSGSSQRQGPLPTEIRIERDVSLVTPAAPGSGDTWQVQRVEWFEPNENIVTQTALAPSTLQVRLPVGIYRLTLTSKYNGSTFIQTRTTFENTNSVAMPTGQDNQLGMSGPIWIQKDQNFVVSSNDILCPDYAYSSGTDGSGAALGASAPGPNAVGPILSNRFSAHTFETIEENAPEGSIQPQRITLVPAVATTNLTMRRQRTLATCWDASGTPALAAGITPGQYQFRGGNELFGTGFARFLPTEFAWLPNNASYTAYGTRGPLSALLSQDVTTFDGQTATSHTFVVTPLGLPPGWTSFDLPGPSQASTGGYLPDEQLASAMANGVQVVGRTEQDLAVDALGTYDDFEAEFGSSDLGGNYRPASLSAINRPASMPWGNDPFVVGCRTSTLSGYGTVAALFTPQPDNSPLGGAQPSAGWLLADFLAQAGGSFNVVLRPRGPQGLFTLQNPSSLPGGSAWLSSTGPLSFGRANGSFEGLELLRGESLAGMTPANWFTEFKSVRSDWFNLLDYQSPGAFTKALGLSSANYSIDTPVGLARTYLKADPTLESDLSSVQSALASGAAVASTGPFLDVSIGSAGPGGFVPGPVQGVTLVVNLWKSDWMPVDELRVIINGNLAVTQYLVPSTAQQAASATVQPLAASGTDPRAFSGSITLTPAMFQQYATSGKDAWVVVEAGVDLAGPNQTDANDPNTALWPTWNAIMRGIYPIAVTNPIFVSLTGGNYKPPLP